MQHRPVNPSKISFVLASLLDAQKCRFSTCTSRFLASQGTIQNNAFCQNVAIWMLTGCGLGKVPISGGSGTQVGDFGRYQGASWGHLGENRAVPSRKLAVSGGSRAQVEVPGRKLGPSRGKPRMFADFYFEIQHRSISSTVIDVTSISNLGNVTVQARKVH